MERFLHKTKDFLNSYYYPILIVATALITHTFSIEPFGIAVYGITVAFGFILCEDLRFFITPIITFILMFSQKSVKSGIFYKTPYIVAIVIFAVYLVTIMVLHFVIHKKSSDFKGFYKSKLFWGFVALCGAYLLNGFFNFDEYTFGNIAFALVMIISTGVIFFLFRTGLPDAGDTKKYLFFVLYLISIMATLQFFLSFIYQIELVNGEIVKESVMFGWGMWNNMGGLLAFLLPSHFYFACTAKRFGFLFYGSGLVSYLAIVLSLSRSSLLISTLIIGVCAIVCCFAGCNKKINRIITVGIIAVGIIGIIVLWSKISNILGDYLSRGFDDNGRFDIYRRGIENFLNHPVFGGGFSSAKAQEYEFAIFMPDRYHNTFVQLLGTCGIVGLLAYLFHRFQTVVLMWKKRSIFTLFSALCIASLLLTSMLDNHFFNIYPTFIYAIILAVIDKCEANYSSPLNAESK
ncbi:MAG: O-antigen ligase family protein [Clostridia bacterium]|nr:O-antigen ligase family protein [Clostridia bacterium]